jgi:hypothetical protein
LEDPDADLEYNRITGAAASLISPKPLQFSLGALGALLFSHPTVVL